jgi:hypothetical protein
MILPGLLICWIAEDMLVPRQSTLTRFDGHEVGRLETAMWRSYYAHQPARLYGQLLDLMRNQYHLPFWRASLAAWHAAHAAVVFQRGHNRGEYELALPGLADYYSLIRRSSDIPFSVYKIRQWHLCDSWSQCLRGVAPVVRLQRPWLPVKHNARDACEANCGGYVLIGGRCLANWAGSTSRRRQEREPE